MIKPASRQTLHDNILSQMTQAIKSGQWKAGERVPGEQELAHLFQVSRSSIREVLKAFVLSGVMEAHPGQGTFLTANAQVRLRDGQPSSLWEEASLSDMHEVRLLLEGQAAFQAAQRARDEEIAHLGETLETIRGDNSREVHEAFHLKIATMSGNPLLHGLLASLKKQIIILRGRYAELLPNERIEAFYDEHSLIYRMIRDRKPDEARVAMTGHIEAAWKAVIFSKVGSKPREVGEVELKQASSELPAESLLPEQGW